MLRRGAMGGIVTVAATVALLAFATSAPAAPATPIGHEGRWLTDANGRVVIMHGVNMVYKAPPYAPSAAGFGADDAQFLADNGFNTVRLGLIYKAVEPAPGVYDDAYLANIAETERVMGAHGVFSMLDFHQDLYGERFHGEGWPDWAVQDDGLPNEPDLGFPGNYVGMPALWRAFDHFWANDPGPGGVGLRDRYVAALAQTAEHFAGSRTTIGYDLMNEPFPGTPWATCAVPVIGCPLFDAGPLAAFSEAGAAAIRTVEPQKLVWYEPNVLFDFGAGSSHPALSDEQSGFSFHDYCLPGAFGLPIPTGDACGVLEDTVMAGADSHSAATGAALMLSEFGATPDTTVQKRVTNLADDHMVSWQEWHYCGCSDPTTQAGPGDGQALVRDPALPPTGSNVIEAKLKALSRPYPQTIAGTPTSYGFDEASKTFDFDYSTQRADGGGNFQPVPGPGAQVSRTSPQTEVFVPPVHFPSGYDIDVEGAGIASKPGERLLKLIACPGATDVTVRVSAPGEGAGDGPDCAVEPEPEAVPASSGAQGNPHAGTVKKCKKRKAKKKSKHKAKKKRCGKKKRKKKNRR